jgi:hypothetical protein
VLKQNLQAPAAVAVAQQWAAALQPDVAGGIFLAVMVVAMQQERMLM